MSLMLGRMLVPCNPTFVIVGITVVTYQFEYIEDRDSVAFYESRSFLEIQ